MLQNKGHPGFQAIASGYEFLRNENAVVQIIAIKRTVAFPWERYLYSIYQLTIMPNTFTQLYTHLVFAVKHRQALIQPSFRDEVERYMTGILQNKKHKLLAIYLMPDHAHILIGQNPAISLSETVSVLKTETTNFIKENRFTPFKFNWQEGYGAFSHSRSDLNNVVKYILNQPEHHKKKTFRAEYLAMLQRWDIEFQEEYLFEFFDDLPLEDTDPTGR